MISSMARRKLVLSDHLRNSQAHDLLRRGDIIFWSGSEHRVVAVEDDPDMANNLRVQIESQDARILIARSSLPTILVSRYEDRTSERVANLREREVRLIRDIHTLRLEGGANDVVLIELRRCLDTVRRELKRKKARKAFEPTDSNVIDL